MVVGEMLPDPTRVKPRVHLARRSRPECAEQPVDDAVGVVQRQNVQDVVLG
jgi:hypothetical protein